MSYTCSSTLQLHYVITTHTDTDARRAHRKRATQPNSGEFATVHGAASAFTRNLLCAMCDCFCFFSRGTPFRELPGAAAALWHARAEKRAICERAKIPCLCCSLALSLGRNSANHVVFKTNLLFKMSLTRRRPCRTTSKGEPRQFFKAAMLT